ncbi:MAG: flavin reductase [Actinomycetaceae bacterium]
MSQRSEVGVSKLSKNEFRDIIGRFASGVTILTSRAGDRDFGTTASAVTSLSDEPPMIIICLNKTSSTAAAIIEAGTFAVNVLAEDHSELAGRFATKLDDKFRGVPFERDEYESPLIVGALAHLTCTVGEQVEAGTHYVFLAHVDDGVAIHGHPLAYFRGAFGRMQTAPDASVLRIVRDRLLELGSDVSAELDHVDLAAELQAEPEMVRRALGALVEEGLVARENGSFTLPPVPEEVLFDHYAAKFALEEGVARQTIGRVTPEQLATMRGLMEETADLVDGATFTDPEAWIRTNNAFHEYMVSLAGSRILLDTYRRLGLPGLERRTITAETYATESLVADHRAMVEAYETEDLDLLLRTLDEHAVKPRYYRELEKRQGASA